ncbi:hypothetical protein HZC32_03845 [Candidatus Woesearchaeota archaeon]|nr:hypothetical protein [Candidatus Woesearchaeota archaeon]
MANKTGALGLSMETLVVIIISLVILVGGIAFLYNLIYSSESIKAQLDEQTNIELEHLLVDQGKQVALPRHTATLEAGESHVFGMGILNTGSEFGMHFKIKVTPNKYSDPLEKPGDDNIIKEAAENWLLFNSELTIAEGEHKTELISVEVPTNALKGQYIFDVKVYYTKDDNEEQYGNTQKIVVNVK